MLRRRLVAVLALPLLVPLLAACSAGDPAALEVNGQQVSQATLESDLKTLAANTAFVSFITGQLGVPLRGGQPDTSAPGENGTSVSPKAWNAKFVSWWLTRELYSEGFHSYLVQKDLTVKDELSAELTDAAAQEFGGEAALTAFPAAFRTKVLRIYGESEAIATAARTALGTPQEYWKAHPELFPATTCISHILVATEAEASAARGRIVGGEDFAGVAKAVSTDPGSKDSGGDLGCGDPTQYVKEFADAAASLQVAELSQPVKSQFGYHLIKVTKKNERSFDATTVAQAMDRATNQQRVEEVGPLLAAAKVDPRFGTVDAQNLQIVPPAAAQ